MNPAIEHIKCTVFTTIHQSKIKKNAIMSMAIYNTMHQTKKQKPKKLLTLNICYIQSTNKNKQIIKRVNKLKVLGIVIDHY